MESTMKVRNPVTGRLIAVGGDTYNGLIARGYVLVNGTLQAPMIAVVNPIVTPVVTPVNIPRPTVIIPKPVVTIPRPVVTIPPRPLAVPIPPRPMSPVKVIIPGTIPSMTNLEDQRRLILQEEEAKRVRLCKSCTELYINRYVPFTAAETNNLGLIVRACSECNNLCDAKYTREGFPNASECHKYKTAAIMGNAQLQKLQAQAFDARVRREAAMGQDVGYLFPSVPK